MTIRNCWFSELRGVRVLFHLVFTLAPHEWVHFLHSRVKETEMHVVMNKSHVSYKWESQGASLANSLMSKTGDTIKSSFILGQFTVLHMCPITCGQHDIMRKLRYKGWRIQRGGFLEAVVCEADIKESIGVSLHHLPCVDQRSAAKSCHGRKLERHGRLGR